MNNNVAAFLIVLVVIVILLVCAVLKKVEWLLNLAMRSILGAIAIYFVNLALAQWGIVPGIGINAVTVLTCGILGIPGLLALYGIGFYQML